MSHQRNVVKFVFCILMVVWTSIASSACLIKTSNGQAIPSLHDPLAQVLTSDCVCPTDVFAFRRLLKNKNLQLETTMVANRGFHNPSQGSFSLFEIVTGKLSSLTIQPGDFFFGHFTTLNKDGYLVADQTPLSNALMIEVLAWDAKKQAYNFYELRGDGKLGLWFYRGDSADIAADNTLLHRQPDPAHPHFGSRLRCSACHENGGPIMKELSFPHNDWWEPQRKLNFGGKEADLALREMMQSLVPPDHLRVAVIAGMNRNSSTALSLQEQLRPLFCPMELNLKSDPIPNDRLQAIIQIPVTFLLDKQLLARDVPSFISISRTDYEKALTKWQSHFPETNLQDADHAWLAPVKAKSDIILITQLVQRKLINEKFVADVLSIDRYNPVFSSKRCALLRFVPLSLSSHWQTTFMQKLRESNNVAAHELANNMRDANKTPSYYQAQNRKFLAQCQIKFRSAGNVNNFYGLLIQRRLEILSSEISANPRGQILEPGFRIIFPEARHIKSHLTLNANCDVITERS